MCILNRLLNHVLNDHICKNWGMCICCFKTTFEIILIYSFSEPINLSTNGERLYILMYNQYVAVLFVLDCKLMVFLGLIVLLLLHLSMEMKKPLSFKCFKSWKSICISTKKKLMTLSNNDCTILQLFSIILRWSEIDYQQI